MASSAEEEEFPRIVTLNVGGQRYTTRLQTLRKYDNSMLAAMFSGRHKVETDHEGCYFIDREGTHFKHILNFLRHTELPPPHLAREVYKEALYYGVDALLEALKESPAIFGELVSRDKFIQRIEGYQEKLDQILGLARKRAVAEQKSEVIVGQDLGMSHVCNGSHFSERVDVTFTAIEFTKVLRCIEGDLKRQGYNVWVEQLGRCTYKESVYDNDTDFHYEEQCRGLINKITFTWW